MVWWVGYYLRIVFYEILFLRMQFLAIMASFTSPLTISPVTKVYLFIQYSWKLRSGWKLDLSQQHFISASCMCTVLLRKSVLWNNVSENAVFSHFSLKNVISNEGCWQAWQEHVCIVRFISTWMFTNSWLRIWLQTSTYSCRLLFCISYLYRIKFRLKIQDTDQI